MFNFTDLEEDRTDKKIYKETKKIIIDKKILEMQIKNFKVSQKRREMIEGEKYYEGYHDILLRKRTAIGEEGKLKTVDNIPNNKIVDNQYCKLVDQKKNYLLGQPIVFKTNNKKYDKELKKIFNKKFQMTVKNIGEDAINTGIGWLYVYYDEKGKLSFKKLKNYEIIPGWKDYEHTELEYAIRLYEIDTYIDGEIKTIEKVEVYDKKGVYRFFLDGEYLVKEKAFFSTYITIKENNKENNLNWEKIPLIPFKYNSKEIPLIRRIKTLQDSLNLTLSNFQNNMEEDTRNTVIVLVNYDGEEASEFRKNLSTYGVIKIRSDREMPGDVKTLQVEVNAENYKTIIDLLKKSIIENAKGFDAKNEKLNGTPNQMNIQSMYSDIDLDANEMETEFQYSLEELLWFVKVYLYNSKIGDFEKEEVEIIFNRDILISESEAIENCQKSSGLISSETIIANHPWIDDPIKEIEKINLEKDSEITEYNNNIFNNIGNIDEK